MTDNTTETARAFDGCNRECRKAGTHTLRWGGCERAPRPESTVSMSKVYADTDGYPSIGYDSYTVPELADLIEPALRRVHARLGPNALAMLHRGETVSLSGGEYADLAREAAHAVVHRNDPAAPAVVPSADRAVLRDRIRRAVCEVDGKGFMWGTDMLEPDEYGDVADAILAVLPAPAELEQEARRLGLMVDEYSTGARALSQKLGEARATNQRLNRRTQALESELAAYRRAVGQWEINERGTYIPHSSLRTIGLASGKDILGSVRHLRHFERVEQAEAAIEDHRLALSVALGLGTGAPWDAIHDRATELAGQPAGADRAAVLTEAERTMLAYALDQAQERIWSEDGFTDEDQAAVDSLRRLAGEAAPDNTEADRP